MLEPIISVIAITVMWLAAYVFHVTAEKTTAIWPYAVLTLLGVGAAYFGIRFIHWAWVTPFIG